MNFLYSNNGNGIFSSLTHSWTFWIIVILVVIVILIFIISSNSKLQEKLHVQEYFNNNNKNNTDNIRATQHQSLLTGDGQISEGEINFNDMNNGALPHLNKYLDVDLDDESEKGAQLLGISDTDKSVKSYYSISSKGDNVFKVITDEKNDVINFKIELKDLTKLSQSAQQTEGAIRIYNQDRKCIVMLNVDARKFYIRSISPLMDDVVLDIDNDKQRLFVFNQVSNKIFVHNKHVATLSIYDKISYFNITSHIIKELQYF